MAGEVAKVTGSGQALPTTSFATIDLGSITSDVDSILTETSAGVYRPDEPGQYLIIVECEHNSTHNNRQNIQWKVQRNSTDHAGSWNDGYSRNTSNSILWIRGFMIAPFNGTTDTFRVQHRRDIGAGTPAGTYTDTTVKVIRLSDTTTALPYGHYGTPTSQSSHTNTWTTVAGLDVITETDTSVIELQAGGSAIRLKEADRPYLFVYSMVNSDSGAGRTHRVTRARHNADPIWHSIASEYQRNSADQYASPSGMGLVRPGTANQDLDFQIIGYTNTHWGVWDTGSWALSAAAGQAGVMVIALPDTVDVAIFEDETGNQTVTGTGLVNINAARTTVGTADSPFSRISNTDVDVTTATDILSHAAIEVDRSTANGTRWTGGIRHEIEGVDNAESRGGGYERGDQSSDDCKDVAIATTYVGAVSANDTLQIEKYNPDGNNGGGTMQTQWAGWFLIDLGSLEVASGTIYDLNGAGAAAADGDGELSPFANLNGAGLAATQGSSALAERTGTAKLALSNTADPADDTNHTLRVRHRVSTGTGDLLIRLMQSSTVIQEWTQSSTTTWTTAELSVTSASSITSYNDLEVWLQGFASPGTTVEHRVSWIELALPEAPSGDVDLDGAGATAAQGSAVLETIADLVGAGGSAASGTSILETIAGLVGSGSAAASGVGTLRSFVDLTGAGSAAAAGSATLETLADLTGAGTAASTGVGVLRSFVDLTAAGAASTSGTGSLTVAGVVDLTGTGHAAASGTAVLESLADLIGASAAAAQGSATLSPLADLDGAGAASAAGSATLETLADLDGAGAASAQGSATLETLADLDGAGAASAQGSATLSPTAELSGAGAASAAGTATLSPTAEMVGAGTAASSGSATLQTLADLIGSGASATQGSGVLRTLQDLTGAGHAATSGDSPLSISGVVNLTGAGTAAADGTGDIATLDDLNGAGASAAAGNAVLRPLADLTGAGSAAAGGSGVLRTFADMEASGASAAQGSATLETLADLDGAGHASAQGSSTLSISGVVSLTGQGAIAAQGSSVLRTLADVTGAGTASASGSAVLRSLSDAQGAGAAAASGGASLTVGANVDLTGAGPAAAEGSAVLATFARLVTSDGSASADGAGVLTLEVGLTATGTAAAAGAALLRTTAGLVATAAAAAAQGAADLSMTFAVEASGHAAAQATAVLSIKLPGAWWTHSPVAATRSPVGASKNPVAATRSPVAYTKDPTPNSKVEQDDETPW